MGPLVMTPAAFFAALDRLGFTRLTAAEWLDVNEKTIRRWGKDGPPKQIAMLLKRELEARQRDR